MAARSLSANDVRRRARNAPRFLILTYENSGPTYSLDSGDRVTVKAARELIGDDMPDNPRQADLFFEPSNDGLFPGFSQTFHSKG